MNLERFEVESVLEELRRRISEADTGFKDRYESGIEFFESYLQGNQREGLFKITGNIKATNIRILKQSKIKNIIRKVYKKITRKL
ncbi:hypothetical protein D3C75_1155500 [compost metagenome]